MTKAEQLAALLLVAQGNGPRAFNDSISGDLGHNAESKLTVANAIARTGGINPNSPQPVPPNWGAGQTSNPDTHAFGPLMSWFLGRQHMGGGQGGPYARAKDHLDFVGVGTPGRGSDE